jgi:alpha-L-fucosidase
MSKSFILLKTSLGAAPIGVLLFAYAMAFAEPVGRPVIRKLGTIDTDIVETTPVVFRGRLYRLEYVRSTYPANKTGNSYFRFIDVQSGRSTPAFAAGYDLGCAVVDQNSIWVFGVKEWDGDIIASFHSSDLEHWERMDALKLPGWGLFNTSVCQAEKRFIMAIEVGRPPSVVGVRFTNRFAESTDLVHWKLLPEDRVFTKERYSACPSIRYLDGQFYMTYLEAKPGPSYETHIVRSKDLILWQASPLNPVLRASPDDKTIANPNLTDAQRKKIAAADDLNNSDADFCEFGGRTIILYSWGNQQGTEFLAEGVYEGRLASFLKAYFP